MAVALNFTGAGAAESGSITVTAGQLVRARFTAFEGSAALRMKITNGGNESYLTVDNKEAWLSPALAGDTVVLAYDGQGNPASKVLGFLEAITI